MRVFAVNGIGDGEFSEEVAGRLFSNEMRLKRMIQENLVETYEGTRPWLRDTWQYMNEPEFDVEVEVVPAGSTTYYATYVLLGCYLYFDAPLRKCDVNKMAFVYEYIGSRLVAIHEMAHIYTLTNGLVADPAPLAIAHVYLDRLDLQGRNCRPSELYADLVTLDLISLIDDDFEDPLNRLPYWEHCNPDYDGDFQPPHDSLTEEALGVVRSALNGQMPQWFSDTYDDAKGNPDLERLWTDIGALGYPYRFTVVYQLRGAFGGYCDERRTTKALSSGSTDTRNPWRDGGCVPGAPGNLIATESDGELTLSWERPDSDGGSKIQAYRVEWKSGSEDYDASRQQMVTDRGSRLSHAITGLTNGTDYTVRVLAVNHNGDGAHSVVTATPHDTDSPALVAAAGVGWTLTLNFSGALDGDSVPSSSVFEVAVADQAVAVTEVSIQSSTVTLKLASALAWNDEVTLEYSVPLEIDASRIQDAAGHGAESFSVAVENHTPAVGNRAATGVPTIDGVVEVGKTLTATVSDVEDADGLAGATFDYQWLSNDGTLDTYILGATDSSYELAAADAGKTIQVRVTFTDDGGTLEALTSAATDEVVAAVYTGGGICDRTEQVRAAILDKLGISKCAAVTVSDLRGLHDLSLRNSAITELKPEDFQNLSNLEELDLADNALVELPAGVFAELSDLRLLQLHSNDLSKLPAGVFDDLSSLEYLHLYRNDLAELPEGVFDELSSLGVLSLGDNDLTELPDGVFDELSGLHVLGLHHNDLTELPEGVFGELSNLLQLFLDGNDLSELPDGVFDDLSSLWHLYLSDNNLVELSGDIFDELDQLLMLFLSGNGLQSLPEGVFDQLHALSYLDLSNNSLQTLPDGAFDHLSELRELELDSNDLNTLPEGVFDDLSNLEELDLSHNVLEELPAGLFHSTSNMLTLRLSNNHLQSLPDGLLDHVVSQQSNPRGPFELFLDDNRLQSLPDGLFDGLANPPSTWKMWLSGNPGVPFVFTAELVGRGNGSFVVKVAQGAPYDMEVILDSLVTRGFRIGTGE